MKVTIRRCVHSNGTLLYNEVIRSSENSTLSTTVLADTTTPMSWADKHEQMFGPNVTCFSEKPQLPKDMKFTEDTLVSVIAYSCMFLVAAVGNIIVLTTLWGSRKTSRVNLCILHLSIADLIVAFIFLPLETTWHVTITWRAGDLACRIFMFLRAFGFYLSSFIIIVISLDRYFSIVHPLTVCSAQRRCKIMLMLAWIATIISSLPQSFIFHVESHPVFTWYQQCVTFNFFPSRAHELAYNLFNFAAVYLLPLVVIITCYLLIFIKISQQRAMHGGSVRSFQPRRVTFIRYLVRNGSARRSLTQHCSNNSAAVTMRCSTTNNLSRAKTRTLQMTLVIVSVFLLCWTPYFSILSFHWFAKKEAQQVDSKVQRFLFMFAVSSACFDPIIYGMFTSTFRRKAERWKRIIHQKLTKQTTVTVA